MFGLGMNEILVIALIILLLFGGKKIPELMKGMGKGVKSFKEGMKEVDDEVKEIKEVKEMTEEEVRSENCFADLLGPLGRFALVADTDGRGCHGAGCGSVLSEGRPVQHRTGPTEQ